MSEVFSTSGESSDITAGPPPNLQGLFIPGIDNSFALDGFGIVTPWGGGSTSRKYGDYGIPSEISRQNTQLSDLASSLIPAEGGGLSYGVQGEQGPQGIRGPQGLPGIITVMGLNLPQNSNFVAALPHNIDLINALGTAADKLIYTNTYTTVGGPTGADLVSGTTDGDTLSEYTTWTEREISFDVAGALQLSYDTTDSTKQGAQSTLHSWYQSFIPTTTFAFTGLEINIDSVISGNANNTLEIFAADADGKPTGSALCDGWLYTTDTGWQGDLAFSSSPTLNSGSRYCFRIKGKGVSGEFHFDFDSGDSYDDGTCWYWNGSSYVAQNGDINFRLYGTGAGVELTSGTKYSVVVKAPDVVGAAELYWSLRSDNLYASGNQFESSDSGSTWTIQEDKDVWFKTKAGAVIKDDDSFSQDDSNSSTSANGVTWLSQTFTATSTYTITSIILKLAKYTALGGTVETVTASIRAADAVAYSEATWAESALTSAGRAILDDADAPAQATTLGLGTGDSPEFTGLELSGGTITVGGAQVLKLDTTLLNTLVGEEAGNSLTGVNNTFLGYRAGYSATDINNIVLLGHQAGYSLTSSITDDEIRSVLIGFQAGYSLTTGEKSTVIGNQALFSETTGENSIAIGHSAGYNQVGSNACVLIGALAGYYNIDGVQNTYIGTHAGRGVETKSGNYNTAVGYRALYTIGTITTGADYNVAVGYEAGLNLTTGGDNVFVGTRAGRDTTDAQYNFALGTHALLENEEGDANVCIGHEAGKSTDGNSINYNALIGYRAGYRLTGNSNIMIGHQTGYDATTLHDSILIGYRAGYNLTTLDDNVMVGKDSGYTGTTADGCTYLGYQTGYTATDAARRICIGHSAGFYDTNSDRFILDNQKRTNAAEEITNALMYGIMAAAPVDQSLRINATLNINGKLTAGSFGSPIDVTVGGAYGFELHYSGNNYDVTGIRSRAQLVTTDTTASAQGAVLQAANNDGIDVGVLNGALIEAIGKSTATAATISTMRGALVGTEWGAFDTVTNLKTLHVRGHSLNAAGAGSFGTGYGIYIENEAVGGNGQAYDAGIYFKGTNLSAGNKAFTYGIDFSGGTYGTTEIKLLSGGTIGSTGASVNVDASGNVGVGVEPSEGKLHIVTSIAGRGIYILQEAGGGLSAVKVDATSGAGAAGFHFIQRSSGAYGGYFQGAHAGAIPLHVRGHNDQTADIFTIGTGAVGNLLTVDKDGNVGIAETDPETLTEWTSTVPYLTLHNSTHEDTDGGGESRLIFKREDGGTTETACAQIEASHDGVVANDQLGKMIFSVNTGAALAQALEIGSDLLVTSSGVIRGATSLWWRIQHVDLSALPATGAVGATYTPQSANNLTGYKLDNTPSEEYLYFNTHVGTDWDEASDLELVIQFETNVDNSAGDITDTVDFDLVMYYKGDGETAQKTQDLDASVVVGQAAQYYHEHVMFTIEYDKADHVVQVGDCISFALHLNDDTPLTQVVNVICHHAMFRYKTKKVRAEV